MTIVVANYARALMPGLNSIFGMSYNEYPEEYKDIFDSRSSDKNFEELLNHHGTGLAQVKSEAGAIEYQDMAQGWIYRVQHVTYGLGFIISREAIDDGQYVEIASQRAKALGMSCRQTRENVGANILNRAFNSSYTYGDGLSLCNTANLLSKGGTYSNRPTNGVDLNELSLEDAIKAIHGYVNDAGLKIAVRPMKLIVHKDNMFDAKRLLGSDLQPNSANHNINALVKMGMLPGGYVVNHYLTDPNAWFIKTDCQDGLIHFDRRGLELSNESDFETENMKFKATYRDSFGVGDKRCIYGSPGA